MFQSLIGWLQTVTFTLHLSSDTLFQSLIGWLQTMMKLQTYMNPFKSFNPLQVGYKQGIQRLKILLAGSFQSLIGWLQTVNHIIKPLYVSLVSIPYRLATNNIYPIKESLRSISFNPLQVGYKLSYEDFVEIVESLVSIPYRLATNNINSIFQGYSFFVSIPYRLATNDVSIIILSLSFSCFNPLQVGYKLVKINKDKI